MPSRCRRSVGGEAELDRLVDHGVGRATVAIASAVPSASAARQAIGVRRRAERRIDAERRRVRRCDQGRRHPIYSPSTPASQA